MTNLEAQLAEALADRADGVPVPPVPDHFSALGTRPARRRGVLLLGGLTAVGAAAVAAVVLIGTLGKPVTNNTDVAAPPVPAVRIEPAAFLIPGTALPMKAGQFFYVRTVSDGSAVYAGIDFDSFQKRTQVESWRPQVRTEDWMYKAQYLNADGSPKGTPQTDKGPCGLYGKVRDTIKCSGDVKASWHNVTPEFVKALPLDPKALYTQWREFVIADLKANYPGEKPDDNSIATQMIGMVPQISRGSGGMSQPFSEALAAATGLIPGVIVTKGAKNLLGVSGTAYEVHNRKYGISMLVIFDGKGNYIGDKHTAISLGAADALGAPPVVTNY
jgi:hypothetical protein